MAVATETKSPKGLMGDLINDSHLDGRIYSGDWKQVKGRIVVEEPATGDRLAEVGSANRDEVFAAAKLAAAAQPAWAATDARERAMILQRAAEALESHREEAEQWLIREGGSAPAKAHFEIGETQKELRDAMALTSRPMGEVLPHAAGRVSMARRVPVGVAGVITPWNFPMILAMRSVAPALALGNAVVLKCDPNTPVSGGLVFARIFEEAGMPEGVFHAIPGDVEAGEAICEAPEIAMVSFTGSTAAGRKVGALAGGNLKRVALELGGKSAFIVCDDADVDGASSAGAWGTFLHQGQICMAAGRHLVHESIADQYIAKLAERGARLPVGNPATEEVALGPIINRKQIDRVQDIVSEAVGAGATAHTGGTADGPYFPPTVLGDMKLDMRAWNEEIFGPVAPVVTFADDDEAIALANDTEYGLSAGVYTSSPARGRAIAERLHTGLAHIGDQPVYDDPVAPFGGIGASGNGGRFGGDASLDEFTTWRWITERDEPATYPF
jgi:benzaldehyde dehydrogenase (NAD)